MIYDDNSGEICKSLGAGIEVVVGDVFRVSVSVVHNVAATGLWFVDCSVFLKKDDAKAQISDNAPNIKGIKALPKMQDTQTILHDQQQMLFPIWLFPIWLGRFD